MLKILYYKEKIQIFEMNMPLFHHVGEKMYISLVASPHMKYAFFASLDEINTLLKTFKGTPDDFP